MINPVVFLKVIGLYPVSNASYFSTVDCNCTAIIEGETIVISENIFSQNEAYPSDMKKITINFYKTLEEILTLLVENKILYFEFLNSKDIWEIKREYFSNLTDLSSN